MVALPVIFVPFKRRFGAVLFVHVAGEILAVGLGGERLLGVVVAKHFLLGVVEFILAVHSVAWEQSSLNVARVLPEIL